MEVFEVFRRSGHKDPFEHVGSVTAPDPEMALLMAKECYFRRAEGEHLWIVARSNLHSLRDESVLLLSEEKSYRFPQAYRGVMELRNKAREMGLGGAPPPGGDGEQPSVPEASEAAP